MAVAQSGEGRSRMVNRRDLIQGAVGALALSLPGARTGAQPANPAGSVREPSAPFNPADLLAFARDLARQPFRPSPKDLPDFAASLNPEQFAAVRAKPSGVVWGGENLGFAIEPLHRGFVFTAPMQIFLIEANAPRRLEYRVEDFEFGSIQPPPNVPDLAFSGFRVLQRRDGALVDVATFQGASFFRARAPGQGFGVQARGLSVRTADPRGEEFPVFKAVWIERPSLAENVLVVHALLDSESTVGLYRMAVRPGEATIIDTEMTLLPRANADVIGIATMSAKSTSTPLDRRRPDDIRPRIAEANGMCMLTGGNEWIWRPITNRTTLQISSFADENPKAFGFLQRDRDFDRYLDDDNHWERRPSLWIEPLGDFGPGEFQLVEIPAENETNNNCVAFWRPRGGIAAGKEASWAYRQFWCWEPPTRPALATTLFSLGGRGASGRRRRFMVGFGGDLLGDEKATAELKASLHASPGSVQSLRWFHERDRARCRVLFEIDPGGENAVEMRLVLEAAGKPLSETWLYRWTA